MANPKQIVGALTVGTIIKSPNHEYLIQEILGVGGFGITYRVTRVSDKRTFAIKEYFPSTLCERGDNDTLSYLKTNASTIETGLNDFITEARRLDKQNISHPNIVSVDEVFKANNTAYYVMEFIDGFNLRQYIVRRNHNKPMSEEQALSVMAPVLQAVSLIHKNKLTHLDIKHDNIVLTEERDGSLRPVLIDFGQAKHYDRKGNATSQLTNAGCSEGFAPQEQYLGLTQFTPQADVYALCATLLYLLTARVPVKSSEMNRSVILDMLGDKGSSRVREALIAGMKASKDERTPTVDILAEELGIDLKDDSADGNVTRLLNIDDGGAVRRKNVVRYVAIALGALLVTTGIIWLLNSPSGSNDGADVIAEHYDDSAPALQEDQSESELLAANQPEQVENEKPAPAEEIDKETMKPDPEPAADKADERTPQGDEQANPQKADSSAPEASAPETPVPAASQSSSDDDVFEKALHNNDWDKLKQLADKGYSKAYLPLAKYYSRNSKTHALADQYARKAKSAGIAGADDVISILEGLGFYD